MVRIRTQHSPSGGETSLALHHIECSKETSAWRASIRDDQVIKTKNILASQVTGRDSMNCQDMPYIHQKIPLSAGMWWVPLQQCVVLSSTPLTRTSPIGAMVKRRAVGQGTDHTVSRRGALSQWRRWVTMFFSCILAFLAVET